MRADGKERREMAAATQGIDRTTEQVSFRWWLVGPGLSWMLSLPLLWIVDPFGVALVWENELYRVIEKLAFLLFALAVLVVLSRNFQAKSPSALVSAVAPAGLWALTSGLVWLSSNGVMSGPLLIAAGFTIGFAKAASVFVWVSLFSRLGFRNMLFWAPVNAMIAMGVGVLITFAPLVMRPLLYVGIVPALIGATIFGARASLASGDPIVAQKALHEASWDSCKQAFREIFNTVVLVCLFCFIWQVMIHLPGVSGQTRALPMLIVSVSSFLASALALFLARNILDAAHGITGYLGVLVFAMCAVILSIPFFFQEWGPLIVGALIFGMHLSALLLVLRVFHKSLDTSRMIVPLTALVAVIVNLGLFAGSALGFFLDLNNAIVETKIVSAVAIGTAYLLFGITVSITRKSVASGKDTGLAGGEERAPVHAPHAENDPFVTLSTNIGALVDEYGLSNREKEVVELLTLGNTVSAIADKLFISENTVRGHTKRIYTKLGIHSRQELLDKVDSYGKRP